jgi:homoserine dehydrogenase
VRREGIRGISSEQLQTCLRDGNRLVLLCLAEPVVVGDESGLRYRYSVSPVALPQSHPLARLTEKEMGIVYESDISGRLFASSQQSDCTPTCGAMIRDLIDIYQGNFQ